ncbi:hypothetical protein B0T21DRAFT_362221 [Apiosordaria backusii]|uniref:Secreted protein n=1 Tax=Apiosordaria backusii TaxID=314023 RepID=A0AA40BS16_9PEZI|nr:hypothetical protein B0T21DRAFT_362221 [Apiosordaria backusii]
MLLISWLALGSMLRVLQGPRVHMRLSPLLAPLDTSVYWICEIERRASIRYFGPEDVWNLSYCGKCGLKQAKASKISKIDTVRVELKIALIRYIPLKS